MLKASLKGVLRRLLGPDRFEAAKYAIEVRFRKNAGYSEAYYERMEAMAGDSYRVFASVVMDEFRPQSAVDGGCGSGAFSLALLSAGLANPVPGQRERRDVEDGSRGPPVIGINGPWIAWSRGDAS